MKYVNYLPLILKSYAKSTFLTIAVFCLTACDKVTQVEKAYEDAGEVYSETGNPTMLIVLIIGTIIGGGLLFAHFNK